jgi:hypothetical protein
MTTTPIMNITLATPLVTSGPAWATLLNNAIGVLDGHDHANTGRKITSAALDIDSDVNFASHSLESVYSVELGSLGSTLSGNNSIYCVNGLLYFNSGSGVPIQLTTLSGINIASVGTIGGDYGQPGVTASASYSNALKTFSWTQDTGIPAKMTFGSFSVGYEAAGGNLVTRSAQSGTAAYTVSYPLAAPALNSMEVFDGSGVGTFKVITGTSNQVTVTFSAGAVTLALPQNIHTAASPTFVGATFSGLTASYAVVTNGSKALASLQYTSSNTASALVQRDGSGNGNFTTLNLSGLTASQVVVTDASKNLTSLKYTALNESNTVVIRGGAGVIEAQGLKLDGLTASYAVVTDSSKNLASLAYAQGNTYNALVQRDSIGDINASTANLSGAMLATDYIRTNTGGPLIKTKKFSGTLSGTQGGSGSGSASFSHGLTASKIMSTTLTVYSALAGGTYYGTSQNNAVSWTGTTMTVSSSIGYTEGQSYVALVVYEA